MMEDDPLSTSLCEAEFERIGLRFWTGEDGGEPIPLDIHTAASVGDTQYISTLPVHQYDLYNSSKWTPLMYSCYLGHRELLHFLLKQNCDIGKCNAEGRTPFMLAGMCGNLEMVQDILKLSEKGKEVLELVDKRNFSALSHAVNGGHLEVAECLLKFGASPNLTEHEKGFSLLMMAASSGNHDTAQLLLSFNADLSYENAVGSTALSVAQDHGHDRIVKLLRKHQFTKSNLSVLTGPAKAELLMQQQRLLSSTASNALFSKMPGVSQLLREQRDIEQQTQMCTEAFLKNLGLEKYSDIFREQEIDFQLLLTLTDGDLRQIGVALLGPRRKITSAISKWKEDDGKIIS